MFADHKVLFCWIWRIKSLHQTIFVCVNKMLFAENGTISKIKQFSNVFVFSFSSSYMWWFSYSCCRIIIKIKAQVEIWVYLPFLELDLFRKFSLLLPSLEFLYPFHSAPEISNFLGYCTKYSLTLMIVSSRMWISSVCICSRLFRQ